MHVCTHVSISFQRKQLYLLQENSRIVYICCHSLSFSLSSPVLPDEVLVVEISILPVVVVVMASAVDIKAFLILKIMTTTIFPRITHDPY